VSENLSQKSKGLANDRTNRTQNAWTKRPTTVVCSPLAETSAGCSAWNQGVRFSPAACEPIVLKKSAQPRRRSNSGSN